MKNVLRIILFLACWSVFVPTASITSSEMKPVAGIKPDQQRTEAIEQSPRRGILHRVLTFLREILLPQGTLAQDPNLAQRQGTKRQPNEGAWTPEGAAEVNHVDHRNGDKTMRELDILLKEMVKLERQANQFFAEQRKRFKGPPHVVLPKRVFSFEVLDELETWEDLPKYGLVAPYDWQHSHKAGRNLILMALKATSWFNYPWVMAHGLLGTNMLDVDVLDRLGYTSLFLSNTQRCKLYASYLNDNNAMLRGVGDGGVRSIISRREGIIYAIAWGLNARYVFDNEGQWARKYTPDPNRKDHKELKETLIAGIALHKELGALGYDDPTLRDILGMAYASLDYDNVLVADVDRSRLGPLQIYRDSLQGALTDLKKNLYHSDAFLEALGREMEVRGLVTSEKILTPENEGEFRAILRIIEADLERIRKDAS